MAHCASARTRLPWKNTHRTRKSTKGFVKNRRPLAGPPQGQGPEGALQMFAPIILALQVYIHRKRRPVRELPDRVLYFASDPSCRSITKRPSVFLSAGTRKFDLWGRTAFGAQSLRVWMFSSWPKEVTVICSAGFASSPF